MIRPLRKLHRLAFLGMAVVVPVVMFMAVAGRSPQPGASRLPVDTADNPSTIVLESADLWRSVAIVTRLLKFEGDKGDGYEIELSTDEIGPQPDLLLYWSRETSAGLPESARLLGPYGGGTQHFVLPPYADPREGVLILYSLTHRSVFATAEVPNNGR